MNTSLTRSSIYTVLTQIPTQIFGIIAGVFITRILGPEGRGLYAIFYADIALFTTLLGFSINTAITHFKAKNAYTDKTLLSVSILFSMVTIVLSLLVLVIWMNLPIAYLLFPEDIITPAYILVFFLFLVLGQINTVNSAIFQGARRFDIVNKVLLFNSVFNLLLFSAAFFIDRFNIIKIGLIEVLSISVFIVFLNGLQWHWHYKRLFSYEFSLKLSWENEIKPFFAFMGLGHLSNVINFFNYRLVLWVMAYYLSNAQIGIFALGAGLAQMLNFISNPLAQVLMPFLSSSSDKDRFNVFVKFARMHFSIVLILGLVGIFVAVPLIPIIYGEDFKESGQVFYLIMTGVIFSTQSKQIAGFFIASNKIMLNLLATIFGFSLTVGFNFWFVRDYGITGAAIAQSITYFGIFIFVYIAMLRYTNFQVKNIFIINQTDIRYAKKRLKQKYRKN